MLLCTWKKKLFLLVALGKKNHIFLKKTLLNGMNQIIFHAISILGRIIFKVRKQPKEIIEAFTVKKLRRMKPVVIICKIKNFNIICYKNHLFLLKTLLI